MAETVLLFPPMETISVAIYEVRRTGRWPGPFQEERFWKTTAVVEESGAVKVPRDVENIGWQAVGSFAVKMLQKLEPMAEAASTAAEKRAWRQRAELVRSIVTGELSGRWPPDLVEKMAEIRDRETQELPARSSWHREMRSRWAVSPSDMLGAVCLSVQHGVQAGRLKRCPLCEEPFVAASAGHGQVLCERCDSASTAELRRLVRLMPSLKARWNGWVRRKHISQPEYERHVGEAWRDIRLVRDGEMTVSEWIETHDKGKMRRPGRPPANTGRAE